MVYETVCMKCDLFRGRSARAFDSILVSLHSLDCFENAKHHDMFPNCLSVWMGCRWPGTMGRTANHAMVSSKLTWHSSIHDVLGDVW